MSHCGLSGLRYPPIVRGSRRLSCYDSKPRSFPGITAVGGLIATKGWKPRVQKTQTLAPIPAAYQPVVRSSSFASGRIAIRLVQMVLDAGLAFLAFYIA